MWWRFCSLEWLKGGDGAVDGMVDRSEGVGVGGIGWGGDGRGAEVSVEKV